MNRLISAHLGHYLGEVFGDDGEGSAAHGKVEVLGVSVQQPAAQPLLQPGVLWRELEKQTTRPTVTFMGGSCSPPHHIKTRA